MTDTSNPGKVSKKIWQCYKTNLNAREMCLIEEKKNLKMTHAIKKV